MRKRRRVAGATAAGLAPRIGHNSHEAPPGSTAVRTVALLSALALSLSLAGCTQGDPNGGDDFVGTCPAWVKGLSSIIAKEGFQNTSMPEQKFDPAHPTGAGLARFQGHPLDLVDLEFWPQRFGREHPQAGQFDPTRPQAVGVANGTLELRVFRSDGNGGVADQLLLHDVATGPNGPRKDVWAFAPGVYKNFTLQVALSAPSEEPLTEPVVLRWDFLPDANTRSPSEAVMLYTSYFWYRTCSSDGTRV